MCRQGSSSTIGKSSSATTSKLPKNYIATGKVCCRSVRALRRALPATARFLQSELMIIAACTQHVEAEFATLLEEQKKGHATRLNAGTCTAQSWFSDSIAHGKSQESCLAWQAQRTAGSWFRTVIHTLRLFHSASFARSLRMSGRMHNIPDPAQMWVQQEQDVWNLAWNVCVELASARPPGSFSNPSPCLLDVLYKPLLRYPHQQPVPDNRSLQRSWSQAWHSFAMPQAYAAVMHPEESVRKYFMQYQRVLYEALLKADDYAKTNDDGVSNALQVCLQDVQFHNWQVTLECFGVSIRSSWNAEDEQVRKQCFSLFASPTNTKWSAEDGFAHLASVVARMNKGANKFNKPLGQIMNPSSPTFFISTITATTMIRYD